MIPARDFQKVGESLRVGQSTRVQHTCGPGNVLKVERKEDGIHAWCFRCCEDGWLPIRMSLEERIARLTGARTADTAARSSLTLPTPQVTDPQLWPVYASVWLYKAGLSNYEIEHRGIYFNPVMDRVIIPVYSEGKLVYWQARGFDRDRPKYINPQVNRSEYVYKAGKGDELVLTEDILSATRFANITEAWSLMGVNLTDSVLLQLIKDGRPVTVALDPDPPGIAGGLSVFNKLQSVGIRARNITHALPMDPKLMTLEDLKWMMTTNA